MHHVELYKWRTLVDRTHNLTNECEFFFLLFNTNLPCIQDDDDDADAAAMCR